VPRPHCATHRDERGGGSRAHARHTAVQVRRCARTIDRARARARSRATGDATTRGDAGRARDLRRSRDEGAATRAGDARRAMTDEGADFVARLEQAHAANGAVVVRRPTNLLRRTGSRAVGVRGERVASRSRRDREGAARWGEDAGVVRAPGSVHHSDHVRGVEVREKSRGPGERGDGFRFRTRAVREID